AGLPSLADRVPRSVLTPYRAGIHPNETAGTLVLLLPVPLLLLLAGSKGCDRWLRAAYASTFVSSLGVLLLTQSRSGWIGAAASAACRGAGWFLRRSGAVWARSLAVAAALSAAVVAGSVWRLGGPEAALALLDRSLGQTGSGISRVELWGRAWLMMRDFPFTG